MSLYFAAITGRDYVKINEKRVPFWDLLDNQPDGWLTSITNIKTGIPESSRRIFDCGAWTYRNEHVPKLNGELVTPEWTYKQYLKHCNPGDILIAPDHMIIPGCDKDFRQGLNFTNAKEFIGLCAKKYNPMVCIHGEDGDEREQMFLEMRELGYKYFAIGGLAAQARKSTYCVEQVERITKIKRDDEYIHVLGLSAPIYSSAWTRIGVSSFDGASHFFKALTAGYFYQKDGGRLIASKNKDEETQIPECSCKSCRTVRKNGGDTRYYGNSLNNIGRAAHNLNIMIALYRRNQ